MGAPWTILVVDGDPATREGLEAALAPRFGVLQASTAAGAVGLVEAYPVHLIILDYHLSDASALEVLPRIKAVLPSVPVLFITGFGSEEVPVEAFRLGVRDYFRKPLDLAELLRRVDLLLEVSGRRQGPRENVLGPGCQWPAPPGGAVPRREPHRVMISRALALVHGRMGQGVTLDLVARSACVSKSHFCRVFKRQMGISFRDYLTRMRIRKAKEMLREPGTSVAEVALAIGYNDMSHFDRVFRRLEGQTPSTYRRPFLLRRKAAQLPLSSATIG